VEIESTDVSFHRVRMKRRVGYGVLLLSVTSLVWAMGASSLAAAFATMLGLFGVLVASILVAMAVRDHGATGGDRAMLRVADGVLTVESAYGQHRHYKLEQVVGGWREELLDADLAVLELNDGTLLVARFPTHRAADVEALLRVVGADARATTIQVARASAGQRGCSSGCLYATALVGIPITATFVAALVNALEQGEDSQLLAWSGIFTAIAAVIVWRATLLLPTAKLTVGSDGVRVKRSFRRQRFIPFDELEKASCSGAELELETQKELIKIRCQNHAGAHAVVQLVEQARRMRERAGEALDLGILDRGERTPDAWRDDLRALAVRGAHYRERAFERTDLLAVAENPNLPPERRVGAALALSEHADDGERRRLRIAAEGCAHPRLRFALERAAEGEVELAALEEMEMAQPPAVVALPAKGSSPFKSSSLNRSMSPKK
jgi:hypothetical protein